MILEFVLAGTVLSPPALAADPAGTHGAASMLTRKNYASLPTPAGPYSLAVRHNETLYLSGMTAFGTGAQGKSVSEQAQAILEQVKRIAEAEGTGMANLIKVTVFVTSMDGIASLRDVLSRNYDGAYPASSLVQVAGLFSPDVNIEIETVFATSNGGADGALRR
ncbi:RidA family protein [Variovorax sp. M-6]|uniref:RidA family protein n=1 Tax=Variovorax sp. M-6 TaxID=3233041 RepID=UPI003F98D0BC